MPERSFIRCGAIARLIVLTATAAFTAAATPTPSLAQYPFGKNKVSYTKKDWKVLQTNDVDIYYYPNEEAVVAFVAPVVQETFEEYSELFGIEFRGRLPLVFYSSHYDFQQTNIVPSLISEYTGGFTDLMKGRIAIPMTGSLWELRHVIRHEMVHAFMLEKLAVVMKERNRFTYSHPPLWFTEGVAEYFANHDANTQSHMFVRDALMHGRLLDLGRLWRIQGSFMMYKQGEAVIRYIATNYGDQGVVQLLNNWWIADDFDIILKYTIDLNLNELNDAFQRHVKRRYYPSILHATFTPDIAKQLTPPQSFHARPAAALAEDGHVQIYAPGAQDGVIAMCRLDDWGDGTRGVVTREVLIEGGRSADFESIPAFRSKIEVNDGVLLFVSKRHERDAVYLWDTKQRQIIDRFLFPGLSVISSPTMSPDRTAFAFSAIDSTGLMDLFIYHIDEARVERLTRDRYTEEDPDFHPTRDILLFSSDRCESGDKERQGIYQIDIPSRTISALTCGDYADANPEWAPDGRSFLFTSDRDGVFNIYLFDYEDQLITRQTSVIGGVTTPSFLPDGSGFVASGYYKGQYHIFRFPLRDSQRVGSTTVAQIDSAGSSWMSREPVEYAYTRQDYKQKLGLDFAGTGIAIDPDFGAVGNGAELVFSDILGNHQYYVFFGNTSQVDGDFFKRLNAGVNYVNLSGRLNYSLGVFHLSGYTGDINTAVRGERRYGVATGVSYPLSKFKRIDSSVVMRFVDRNVTPQFSLSGDVLPAEETHSFIGSLFLTYVVDNTLWTVGGPLKGWRYYATVGHTVDFLGNGFDNTSVQFDVRKYFKITNRIILAERFVTRNSFGSDLQYYYIGGPWDLRGYDFREFSGRTTFLVNSELRFPLIDRFALSFPFGTLETPLIRGSAFFDAGRAIRRDPFSIDWVGSIGLGSELNLGYAPVIRVNFTRQTNFRTISPDTRVEFFIGYNY